MDLLCHITSVDAGAVVSLSGEVDLASAPTLRNALVRAIDEHRGATIVVDLDGVAALDDAGMGVLLGAAGRAREAGGDVVVVVTSARLRERFAITGLARAIEVRQQR